MRHSCRMRRAATRAEVLSPVTAAHREHRSIGRVGPNASFMINESPVTRRENDINALSTPLGAVGVPIRAPPEGHRRRGPVTASGARILPHHRADGK